MFQLTDHFEHLILQGYRKYIFIQFAVLPTNCPHDKLLRKKNEIEHVLQIPLGISRDIRQNV